MDIEVYSPTHAEKWNDFVKRSINGTFLFDRNYMDYHADRFRDHSLVLKEKNNWIAIIPGSIKNHIWISHPGLSYGGIVTSKPLSQNRMVSCLSLVVKHLKAHNVREIKIKLIPLIYLEKPDTGIDYALTAFGFELYRRDLSSTLFLKKPYKFTKGRKASIARAKKQRIPIKSSEDFESFMQLERENLQARHGVSPTHTTSEISLLANRFPSNIKLFVAEYNHETVAGCILYLSNHAAHLQYFATNTKGRDLGAGDLIIDKVINYCLENDIPVFDFGISTEDQGKSVNQGLNRYKESFGAIGTTADFYSLTLAEQEEK